MKLACWYSLSDLMMNMQRSSSVHARLNSHVRAEASPSSFKPTTNTHPISRSISGGNISNLQSPNSHSETESIYLSVPKTNADEFFRKLDKDAWETHPEIKYRNTAKDEIRHPESFVCSTVIERDDRDIYLARGNPLRGQIVYKGKPIVYFGPLSDNYRPKSSQVGCVWFTNDGVPRDDFYVGVFGKDGKPRKENIYYHYAPNVVIRAKLDSYFRGVGNGHYTKDFIGFDADQKPLRSKLTAACSFNNGKIMLDERALLS